MKRISAAEYRASTGKPKRSKYGNRKVVVDGERFDSKREAAYYGELKLREKAGEILELDRQRRFRLAVNGVHVADYIADMVYFDVRRNRHIVADVKGFSSPEFRLKSKLMKAVHGIDIEIVK